MSSFDGDRDEGILGCGRSLPPEAPRGDSTLGGRVSRIILRVSIIIMLLIAAVDSILGARVVLIGLLIVGPCCALFSARWVSTAWVGTIAVGLALFLALPDGFWGTPEQVVFTLAVLMVAVACTWAAGIIGALTRQ